MFDREVDSVSAFKSVVAGAGALLVASDLLQQITRGATFSDQVVKPTYLAGSVLGLIGVFMLALALLAMEARQAGRPGRGRRAVAVAAGFGTMLLAAVQWSTTFLDPAAAKVAPGFINNTPPAILVAGYFGTLAVFGLSWAAYSVVMLRSRAFPRLPVIVILVAALASAVPFLPFTLTVFGIGLVWLGLAAARVPVPGPAPRTGVAPDLVS